MMAKQNVQRIAIPGVPTHEYCLSRLERDCLNPELFTLGINSGDELQDVRDNLSDFFSRAYRPC